MKVTIPRDAIESLLAYAEAEIETRCGCLKDAGDDRAELQGEINEANDLVAAVRRSMKAQRYQPETDIRHPTLEVGDKIGQLLHAVRGEPILSDDETLKIILNGLQEGSRLLVDHLNANYLWD